MDPANWLDAVAGALMPAAPPELRGDLLGKALTVTSTMGRRQVLRLLPSIQFLDLDLDTSEGIVASLIRVLTWWP